MDNKEKLRKALLDLELKLVMTKDNAQKEVIKRGIKEIKKEYSNILLEEISGEKRRGR